MAAFLALALFAVPFPVVVLAAGAVGWLLGRHRPGSMTPAGGGRRRARPLIADDALHADRPTARRTGTLLVVGLLVWWVPVALVIGLTGRDSTLSTQGVFFSGTALVTFGGAYAVLAYVAQRAVETYGWLAPDEMVARAGPGRDHARAVDHGAAVRRGSSGRTATRAGWTPGSRRRSARR